ncbi:putative protein of unknown function (DUF4499) [Trypanosoma cruzi]|nr:putative protein of unknown function (DUF4499) [Trypanosoma cruzi]
MNSEGRRKGRGEEDGDVVRLKYRMPRMTFAPMFLLFFLLNYLAWFTTVNEAGTDLVMSPYVATLKARKAHALRNEEYPFDMQLFFEDVVLRNLFRLSQLFGGMKGVRLIWCFAWLVHCMELGIAFRICFSCRARTAVFAVYCLFTVAGGLTQLLPLIEARDAYLSLLQKKKNKKE